MYCEICEACARADGYLRLNPYAFVATLCYVLIFNHPVRKASCPPRLISSSAIFGNGYGKLKEQTFRIAHMGDITIDDLKELLAWIDKEIT